MKITVSVKAGAKIEKVEKIDAKNYKLWVKAPARENKANLAVVKTLAKHFGISKSRISLKAGSKSKIKVIEVGEE